MIIAWLVFSNFPCDWNTIDNGNVQKHESESETRWKQWIIIKVESISHAKFHFNWDSFKRKNALRFIFDVQCVCMNCRFTIRCRLLRIIDFIAMRALESDASTLNVLNVFNSSCVSFKTANSCEILKITLALPRRRVSSQPNRRSKTLRIVYSDTNKKFVFLSILSDIRGPNQIQIKN